MSLPKAELDALITELQPLQGAKVQRIAQPSLDEFIFQVRAPGQTHLLYVNIAPPHERLHLIPSKPRSLPNPTAFCMALRKELIGARISALAILPNDRIVQLELAHKDDTHTLWIELLPRRANLLMFDREGGFMQAYHGVSTTRHLRRGDEYTPPEAPNREVARTPIALPEASEASPFPFNEAIASKYTEHANAQRFQREKQAALKKRRGERKKRQRLAQNLARDADRCEAALAREQEGELLKGAMHTIKRGADSIDVVDYYDPAMPTRTIPLDPALSPQANLDRLFHKLKRARKGLANIAPRLEAVEYRLLELDEELEAIAAAETWEALEPYVESEGEASASSPKKKHKRESKSLPYHEFQSADGKRILVGRNSRGNDELTFRVARGNDLWLHVRGIPGSHVVIPMQKGAEASSELQIDAATLAAHFSKARGEKYVDVMITPARYVRKPKGAPLGQVSVIRDSNIALRVEEPRLKRLLGKDEIFGAKSN